MEPTPPRKAKEQRPFYEPPENKPTSARIINEARSSLRSLRTTRPFTPRDEHRSLFGSSSSRNPESRPPSAFSLGSRHFDGSDSRPVSGTRLTPLEHAPKQITESELENVILPPKPPSDPNKSQTRKTSRTRLHHATSVDNNAEGLAQNKSGSLTDIYTFAKESDQTSPEEPRRTHSGPKERTPLPVQSSSELPRRSHSGPKERTPCPVEERGVGDGKEMPARAPSSFSVKSPLASVDSKSRSSVHEDSSSTKRIPVGGSAAKHSSGVVVVDDKPEDTEFFDDHIVSMLSDMKILARNKEVSSLSELLDKLYGWMERENLLGKNCKQRSQILKAVFKILDIDDACLMLKLARLILALKVSGNNLLNVCRLVFKVSRNEKNDTFFMEDKVVDLLLDTIKTTDHVVGCEALIYCVGTLKFLTGNTTLCKLLVKKCCIENLAQLLTNINKTNRENGKANDQQGHILVQLTAALRNLADSTSSRERFLSARVVESLSCVMDMHATDADLVLNISRIFSKMTLHTDCCIALGEQTKSYRTFLGLLERHEQKEDIVVRVCFILGNMTAKNDYARIRLFQETNCMEILLSVLKKYLELDCSLNPKESKSTPSKSENGVHESRPDSKSEDVLIKIIRVIANLCINDSVGPVIAVNQIFVELLLKILDSKDTHTSEELVLNTVATINNMSYYNVKNNAISVLQSKVLGSLLKLVLTDDMEAMVEAARVFGNLTREKSVRNFLSGKQVDVMMITLLDSGNREVVYIACGVLINFMVDEEKRATLKKEGGIKKLIEVLRDFGRTDWVLASMVCQTLWNYSSKITSTEACFGESETRTLADLLIEYLDKEAALDIPEEDGIEEEVRQYLQDTWQADFCPVAESLLTRLESHQSDLEPLEGPNG